MKEKNSVNSINVLQNTPIMSGEAFCEVKCVNGHWFPSGIQFGSAEAYFAVTTKGNIQVCPFCRARTPMNKDNMRFGERREDGGVFYIEGKDTL